MEAKEVWREFHGIARHVAMTEDDAFLLHNHGLSLILRGVKIEDRQVDRESS